MQLTEYEANLHSKYSQSRAGSCLCQSPRTRSFVDFEVEDTVEDSAISVRGAAMCVDARSASASGYSAHTYSIAYLHISLK